MLDGHPFPPEVERLLWDVDPDGVDLDRHADYVMERIMSRGGWVAMKWLRRVYSAPRLADFLERRGLRLAPREHTYWALIAGLPPPARRGGARPAWAGP